MLEALSGGQWNQVCSVEKRTTNVASFLKWTRLVEILIPDTPLTLVWVSGSHQGPVCTAPYPPHLAMSTDIFGAWRG